MQLTVSYRTGAGVRSSLQRDSRSVCYRRSSRPSGSNGAAPARDRLTRAISARSFINHRCGTVRTDPR
jgi:hypothetical protein